ncbi:hypothetical protein Metli_0187 [Methanofollis liminatans DSM 4140]|uniref:DUF6884 domain-containing protein n=1 Tax=Methanofollis liminatans DSM 4140 TaxID=28892 RepID=J1AMU9_9EURY|nr:tRNA-guanine transglycosylase DpdA [Methanofollis liminatans]EJG06163.1 hypothetical protein Metli_0187 [Methanofollis liminatans DSM 4140]
MRYFIPEWDDRVDPHYDFLTDTHSQTHSDDPVKNDSYMWDLLGVENVPFNGVLVSIATIEQNKKKYAMIKEQGIHRFFGLPDSFPIMADCGAFSYIDEDVPPYRTSDILEKYSEMGFNYGVSVDHLVVKAFEEKKEERMEITYQNGLSAFEEWNKKYRDDFQLIVAVQGFSTDDYLRMYHKFLDRGITHMAMGGLVRSQTSEIIDLIDRLIADLKKNSKIHGASRKPEYLHFFGVARPDLFFRLKELESLGVEVAFDSASYLRRAWLASPTSQMNYITQDQIGYTAIRIPQDLSKKQRESLDPEIYHRLEEKALSTLRAYDHDKADLDEALDVLRDLGDYIGERPEILEHYRRTLKDQPWKKCPCPICRKNGMDTIIFRGNNRNRRRGFHNTISFFTLLRNEGQWDRTYAGTEIETLEEFSYGQSVLVITGCTKNKCEIGENRKVAAKDLYTGTLFTKVRAFCEGMGYDYRIISAKYGILSPEDQITTYEKVLKSRADADQIRPSVEAGLKPILDMYDTILVIAGVQYRDVLKHIIDERFVFLKAKGIGDLIHKVSVAIPDVNRTINEFSRDQ